VVNGIFSLLTNTYVLEKQVNIRPRNGHEKVYSSIDEKDNLTCVASIWIGGSRVNVRLQCIEDEYIPKA